MTDRHPNSAITVYFDGACPVCRREVALYRRLTAPDTVAWCDLAGPTNVLADEPFTLTEALELLHVRDGSGTLHVGLDAHLVLWQHLPVLRNVVPALRRWPVLRRPVEAFNLGFTRRRPGLLQRRRRGGARHV